MNTWGTRGKPGLNQYLMEEARPRRSDGALWGLMCLCVCVCLPWDPQAAKDTGLFFPLPLVLSRGTEHETPPADVWSTILK